MIDYSWLVVGGVTTIARLRRPGLPASASVAFARAKLRIGAGRKF